MFIVLTFLDEIQGLQEKKKRDKGSPFLSLRHSPCPEGQSSTPVTTKKVTSKPTTFTPVSKTVTQPTTHSSSATGLVKTLKGECTNKLFMKTEDNISIITKLFHFSYYMYFLFFLAIDFCHFCVVIQFFHPRHNGQ